MSLLLRNLSRINAILLVLVTPIMVRFWIEGVVWRLERGRQMLGFSLMHAGAGWMTLPLILSFLAIFLYGLWVAAILLLWAIPASRARMARPHHALLGGASVFFFFEIAEFLQRDISNGFVLIGAVGMVALAGVVTWLIYAGVRPAREGDA